MYVSQFWTSTAMCQIRIEKSFPDFIAAGVADKGYLLRLLITKIISENVGAYVKSITVFQEMCT